MDLTLAVVHEHGSDEAGPDAGAVVLAVLGRHLVDPVGEEGVAALELHGGRVDAVARRDVLRAHEVLLLVLERLQNEEVEVEVEAAVLPEVGQPELK